MKVKVFNKLERADYNNKRGENGYFRKTYYLPSGVLPGQSYLFNLDTLFEFCEIKRQDADVVGVAFNDGVYIDKSYFQGYLKNCVVEIDEGGMYFHVIPDYMYKIYIYFREKDYKGD